MCHGWCNRFRKLLVRHEKPERSFVALNHIAAAIIAFRKVWPGRAQFASQRRYACDRR